MFCAVCQQPEMKYAGDRPNETLNLHVCVKIRCWFERRLLYYMNEIGSIDIDDISFNDEIGLLFISLPYSSTSVFFFKKVYTVTQNKH